MLPEHMYMTELGKMAYMALYLPLALGLMRFSVHGLSVSINPHLSSLDPWLVEVPAQFLEAILFGQEQMEAVSDLATQTSRSKGHFLQKLGEDILPGGSIAGVEKRVAA